LIATGIVRLVIAAITVSVAMDFLRGLRSSANVGGAPLRLRRVALWATLGVFWIDWTLPLTVAAYRLGNGY